MASNVSAASLIMVMIAALGCGRVNFDATGDSGASDAAPPCPTCDQGLIAHWRFDDPIGSTVTDDIAGHDGILQGTAALRPGQGKLGGALELQGGGAYARVDWDLAPAVTTGMTVAQWVRADSAGQTTNARYFSNYYYYTSNNGLLELDNDLINGLRCVLRIGGAFETATSTVQMQPLTWTHVACVYNGSQLLVYLDGQPTGSVNGTGALSTSMSMPVGIGASTDFAGTEQNHFVGMLDDVRVYDRGLDPAEIQALANQ